MPTGAFVEPTVLFIGRPNVPGLFLIGLENHELANGARFPLDLSPLGMTGCTLNVDPLVILHAQSDARGRAILSLPFKPPQNAPIVLHAQGIHLDPSKPSGIATTNAVHSVLSDLWLSNHCYNWSRDGKSAQFGPYLSNRGVVMLLRP